MSYFLNKSFLVVHNVFIRFFKKKKKKKKKLGGVLKLFILSKEIFV